MNNTTKAALITLIIVPSIYLIFVVFAVKFENSTTKEEFFTNSDYDKVETAINNESFKEAENLINDYLKKDNSFPNNAYCEILQGKLYLKQDKIEKARVVIDKLRRFTGARFMFKSVYLKDENNPTKHEMELLLYFGKSGIASYKKGIDEKMTIGGLLSGIFATMDLKSLGLLIFSFVSCFKITLKLLDKRATKTEYKIP